MSAGAKCWRERQRETERERERERERLISVEEVLFYTE